MIVFTREPDAGYAATFSPAEAELLSSLAGQVADLLIETAAPGDGDPLPGLVIGGGESLPADPALARLLPNAYADDDAASEFRRLTERGLAGRKRANASAVVAALSSAHDAEDGDRVVTLDDASALAWLRAITDIRLVIAARIGIETEEDAEELERDDDPEVEAMLDVYNWLAYVQESLVAVLEP
jgi:hypothetical protein